MQKVLITDDCHPLLIEGLQARGYECDFLPDISPEETRQRIGAYAGLVINSKIWVNREFLDAATQLQFVARLGSGMEVVDREYAQQKGVWVISSPQGNRNAVAEQALGMMLALHQHLIRADREIRQDVWRREQNRGHEVMGRSIGIVGFGHTGSQFAQKLSGMGMRVMAYDKYLPAGYAAAMPWVEESNLIGLQRQCDIISLHLPLTAETRHLVQDPFIEQCKRGFILINTARGACVKTEDVVRALEDGRIGGACLDVFENEKPATRTPQEQQMYEHLYRLENVVLAPHIAGWTHESKRRMAEVLLEKLDSRMSDASSRFSRAH